MPRLVFDACNSALAQPRLCVYHRYLVLFFNWTEMRTTMDSQTLGQDSEFRMGGAYNKSFDLY